MKRSSSKSSSRSRSSIVPFIFRRDIRLEDNIPLQEALDFAQENNAKVVPLFIFSKLQVGKPAPVKSYNSIACLFQSLEELNSSFAKHFKVKLHFYYDDNISVLRSLGKNHTILSIYETKDYTPFAKDRSEKIQEFCDKEGIIYNLIDYLYLIAPGELSNKSGKTYQKFTPFYNAALASIKLISKSEGLVKAKPSDFISLKNTKSLSSIKSSIFSVKSLKDSKNRIYKGGRSEGEELLKNLKEIKNYSDIRDLLPNYTSGLSVHHHYGTVSIRESYEAAQKLINSGAKQMKEFQRQLFWRDFYGHLCDSFDELYGKKHGDLLELIKERPKMSKEKEAYFENWCKGTTGDELVDAAMKQLNQTGYQHNRSRLFCSSILTKTYKIPFQYGAGYFAEKLSDYDFVQNSFNWMFVSGGYPFSEPPFRKVSLIRQAKKLDPDGEYVKKWI
jgi:deoxyribodipyrimidine photo-lyase